MRNLINIITGSDATLLVVLGLTFVTFFVLGLMLLARRQRTQRRRSLTRLLGRRSKTTETAPTTETQWIPAGLSQAGERFAKAAGFSGRLDERLERAGLPVAAGEFVAIAAVCALAGAVFAAILITNIIFVLLVAGFAAALPYLWLTRAEGKRKKKLEDQLPDTLSILASSLRAGYSFLQALDAVSKEVGEPSATEFQRVVSEIRLGRPVDDAMTAMAKRVGSQDLDWAVLAVNIQREVGGNLAEVLDIVANTVRERGYIRRQVKVLSAEGKISAVVLALLPILLAVYMAIVNPSYVNLLFTTGLGMVLLVVTGVLMVVGIFWMTRIVKIDV